MFLLSMLTQGCYHRVQAARAVLQGYLLGVITVINNNNRKMLEASLFGPHPIPCPRHRSEPASHICTEPRCASQPLLCKQCLSEQLTRTYHYDHDKSITTFDEGIDSLCQAIRNSMPTMQRVYRATVGRPQCAGLLACLGRGQGVYVGLEERVEAIKVQIEGQLQLLVKEFQKAVLVEKQEYFKMLDQYQKNYLQNLEHVRQQSSAVLEFNNAVKYYSNRNNLYMKLSREVRKQSDWLVRTKKAISHAIRNTENANLSTQLSSLLTSATSLRLDAMPVWRGDGSGHDRGNQMRNVVKKSLSSWIDLPEVRLLNVHGSGNGVSEVTVPSLSYGGKNYYMGK